MVHIEENGTASSRQAGSTVQDRLPIKMPRKEEKNVQVGLTVLATAVRKQRVGVLQVLGTKPIHRNHIPLLEEEASIGFVAKVLEARTRSPILRRLGVKIVVDLAGMD
jgi:hypothetical protein